MAVTVVYNGQTIPNVMSGFDFNESYEEISFSCSFMIKESSASSLVSSCNNIEEKFREPYESLTLNFDGSSEYNFSHDDNTALNSKAYIQKVNSGFDTRTTRMYKFTFKAELPADKSGFNFRRRGDFSVEILPTEKRRVIFSLEYTASPSPDQTSDENFDTHAQTYAVGVLTSLFGGASFFLSGPIQKSQDHERKVTQGRLEYEEIFEDESQVGTDDPKLKNVDSSYYVERSQRIGVSSGNYVAIPLTLVSVTYRAELVKSEFATNDEVHSYYRTNIKTHMVNRAIVNLDIENLINSSTNFIITNDNFNFDPVNYTITGKLTFVAPESLNSIIFLSEEIRENYDLGLLLRKLWDGKDDTYVGYHLGSTTYITRVTTVLQIGSRPSAPSLLPQQNLKLLSRFRSGREEQDNTNAEVGNVGVRYFNETFLEVYVRAELVNQLNIQIPVLTFVE